MPGEPDASLRSAWHGGTAQPVKDSSSPLNRALCALLIGIEKGQRNAAFATEIVIWQTANAWHKLYTDVYTPENKKSLESVIEKHKNKIEQDFYLYEILKIIPIHIIFFQKNFRIENENI